MKLSQTLFSWLNGRKNHTWTTYALSVHYMAALRLPATTFVSRARRADFPLQPGCSCAVENRIHTRDNGDALPAAVSGARCAKILPACRPSC